MKETLVYILDDIQESGTSFQMIECHGCNYPDTISNEAVADHLIANGVTVQRWIPVAERLPKAGEAVLCINKKGNMFVAYHSKSLNDLFVLPEFPIGHKGLRRATHWMPLPEPPGKD